MYKFPRKVVFYADIVPATPPGINA
jgi:hypothetical protein